MIHTSLPGNCVVFLLLWELTRSAIYGTQKFHSHKWPTVLVDEVKGKPCNFEVCLCGSLYSTFTTSFYPYAFYNKWLQHFSKTNSTDLRQRVPLIQNYHWLSTHPFIKEFCRRIQLLRIYGGVDSAVMLTDSVH